MISVPSFWIYSYPLYAYVIKTKIKKAYDLVIIDVGKNHLLGRTRFKSKQESLDSLKKTCKSYLGDNFNIVFPGTYTA